MNTRQSSIFERSIETLVKSGRWIAAVCLLLAIVCIAILVGHVKYHRTPEYALNQIQAIKSEADIEAHEDYLTKRGRKIFAMAIWAANDEKVSPSFSSPTLQGGTLTAKFTDPKVEGWLEFKQDGVWQLDNVVLTKLNGHTFFADLSAVAEPMYALGHAIEDKSKGQIMADNRYLTEKGKNVRLWLLEQHDEHKANDDNIVIDEPIVDGSTAYFPAHSVDGETELKFVVVNSYEGWQFDDLVAVRVQGKTINLAISDKLNNPFGTWIKSLFW